jgi:hypothetical protein
MTTPADLDLERAVEGKVVNLLVLIVLVQFAYPVTAFGMLALILYEILYSSMIAVGVVDGLTRLWFTLVFAQGRGFPQTIVL